MQFTDENIAIGAPSNDRVKEVVKLSRRRERRERGLFLVEGPNPVVEAGRDGCLVDVFATVEAANSLDEDQLAVVDPDLLIIVSEMAMERLATTKAPQGIVATASIPALDMATVLKASRVMVLDGINDPGNVGTMIRTADAAGFASVLLGPECADPYGPKAVRAAAGSTTHVQIAETDSLSESLAAFIGAHQGGAVLGLDGYAKEALTPDHVAVAVAVVVGSEAHGLSADARRACTARVRLPMHGRAESLNAAIAAALAMYAVGPGGTHNA